MSTALLNTALTAVTGLNWRTWVIIVLTALLTASVILNAVEMSKDTVNRRVIDARKQEIVNLLAKDSVLLLANGRIQLEKDSITKQIDTLNIRIDGYENGKIKRDNNTHKAVTAAAHLSAPQSLGNLLEWTK